MNHYSWFRFMCERRCSYKHKRVGLNDACTAWARALDRDIESLELTFVNSATLALKAEQIITQRCGSMSPSIYIPQSWGCSVQLPLACKCRTLLDGLCIHFTLCNTLTNTISTIIMNTQAMWNDNNDCQPIFCRADRLSVPSQSTEQSLQSNWTSSFVLTRT